MTPGYYLHGAYKIVEQGWVQLRFLLPHDMPEVLAVARALADLEDAIRKGNWK